MHADPSFAIVAFLGIVAYTGLAVMVFVQQPRHLIRWVYFALCFVVVNYYLTSLFLFPKPGPELEVTPFALRWKWSAISLCPSVYIHLTSFFFTEKWQKRHIRIIQASYLASLAFAAFALFTDLLVAGPLYRVGGFVIGPQTGPLMSLFMLFLATSIVWGNIVLALSFYQSDDQQHRQQIIHMAIPFVLLVVITLYNATMIITEDNGENFPHYVSDVLILSLVVFLARAVLLRRENVEISLGRRDLISFCGSILALVVAVVLTSSIDHHISHMLPFPIPLATATLMSTVFLAFPVLQKRFFSPSSRSQVDQPAGPTIETADNRDETLPPGEQSAPKALEIYVLGPFQVRRNGELVPEDAWGSERAKLLFAYLLDKSKVTFSRDELIELLWPESDPVETGNNFHVTLYRLRRALEPDLKRGKDSSYIKHIGGRYQFNWKSSCWLDLEEFLSKIDSDVPEEIIEAVRLYRGYYLADLDLPHSTEVEAYRHSLEVKHLAALRQLVVMIDDQQAIQFQDRILQLDPSDETAQRAVNNYLKEN